MPHITLEYSDNIKGKINFPQLFAELHQALASVAGADIAACKSRAIKLENYHIGEGNANNAMVHVNLELLTGRPLEAKQKANDIFVEILKKYFLPITSQLNLQISSNIRDISRDHYKKYPG